MAADPSSDPGAEQRSENEHARLLQFMYLMPVGVLSAAADGTVKAINPFAAQVLMPVAASTGFLNLFEILQKIAPDLRARLHDFSGRSGEICRQQLVRAGHEGSADGVSWIEVSLSRLGDGEYMAVFSDVTEKVKLEYDVRYQSERFHMLVEFIRDYVIYTLDPNGIVDTWNKSGERYAGISSVDALGRSFADVFKVFGGDADKASGLLARADIDGSCEVECHVGSLGGTLWFQKAITKLTDQHGELAGYAVIAHNVTEHKLLELRLKHLSETDPLTGAANRRAFTAQLDQVLEHAGRTADTVGVAVLDIDYFKLLNDRYGHAAGDAALQAFVKTVTRALRKGDVLGRLGGEEFGIALYGADPKSLLELLERVRREVECLAVPFGEDTLSFTVSIGVSFGEPGLLHDAQPLMRAADEALYKAKAAGRNRVEQLAAA